MFEKLLRLNFVKNKNNIFYILSALSIFIFLIPFTFILKLFLLLASAILGVSLWIKRETFFPKKKRTLSKRKLPTRTRKNAKDSPG